MGLFFCVNKHEKHKKIACKHKFRSLVCKHLFMILSFIYFMTYSRTWTVFTSASAGVFAFLFISD